jgi:GntR family transcriptional regulator
VAGDRRAVLEEMRPRLLDRSIVPMPPEAAAALDAETGEACLRLEYVSLINDEPISLATNYVRRPEAERIRTTPFVKDWYRLLADAGLDGFESRFIIGGALADELVARHLEVRAGSPVMTLEQVIYDGRGRPFDLAFVVTRTDRFRLVSWSTVESTHATVADRCGAAPPPGHPFPVDHDHRRIQP